MSDKFTYFNCCVSWDREKVDTPDGLCAMIETGREVSLTTFRRLIDPEAYRQIISSLGYAPRRSQGLVLEDDYHVSFYTGTLNGTRVAWMVHSAIEYVFTPKTFTY